MSLERADSEGISKTREYAQKSRVAKMLCNCCKHTDNMTSGGVDSEGISNMCECIQGLHMANILCKCCRYKDNMTSERVDSEGISNIAEAAKQFLPAQKLQPEMEQILSMRSAQDLEKWEKLDDTIMGGKSGSFLQSAKDLHGFQGGYDHKSDYQFEGSVWRGELITEGGGFCGARTKVIRLFTTLQMVLFCLYHSCAAHTHR